MLNTPLGIEERLYRAYWDDGMLDLLCGIALLTIGISWWMDLAVVVAVLPIMVALWFPLRRAVVEPRAGYVEFSQARQSKVNKGLKMAITLGIGTFFLGIGLFFYVQNAPLDGLGYYIPGLPAFLLAVGALIGAQMIGARRFEVYALVLAYSAAMTIVMEWGPALPMLAGGAVVTFWGLVLMVRFLRASAAFEGGV